jgi:hypothetical protein
VNVPTNHPNDQEKEEEAEEEEERVDRTCGMYVWYVVIRLFGAFFVFVFVRNQLARN